MIALPQQVELVLRRVMSSGGEAYLVGGALRDLLLNRPVQDYDMAVSLEPDLIERLFADFRTYPTGKRFGTITVVVEDLSIEITTFRGEQGYSDSRHPDMVHFVSDINTDLSRRDFTMNALAYNPYSNTGIIDPFGGRKDLANRVLRTVGCAEERFQEDPLRMMRAIRFTAQLEFDLAPETRTALCTLHTRLQMVAVERIREELQKLLRAPRPDLGIELLQESGILDILFPVVDARRPRLTKGQLTLIRKGADTCPLRLAILLNALYDHPLQQTHQIQNVLRGLRFSKDNIQYIMKALEGHSALLSCELTPFHLRRLSGLYQPALVDDLMRWVHLESTLSNNVDWMDRCFHVQKILDAIRFYQDPVNFSDLAIRGQDLLDIGVGAEDGCLVGQALRLAYEWVLKNPELNRRQLLLDRLTREFQTDRISPEHGENGN